MLGLKWFVYLFLYLPLLQLTVLSLLLLLLQAYQCAKTAVVVAVASLPNGAW